MVELSNCDVHFIRCIKPNEEKRSKYFVPLMSLNQIRFFYLLITHFIKLLNIIIDIWAFWTLLK